MGRTPSLRRCGCGIWPRARSCARSWGIRTWFIAWRMRRTASRWPRHLGIRFPAKHVACPAGNLSDGSTTGDDRWEPTAQDAGRARRAVPYCESDSRHEGRHEVGRISTQCKDSRLNQLRRSSSGCAAASREGSARPGGKPPPTTSCNPHPHRVDSTTMCASPAWP